MFDNSFVNREEFESFRQEFQDFRAEMRAEFAAVRQEFVIVRQQMEAMREELRAELREAVAVLTQRLDRHERWLTVLSTCQVLTFTLLVYVVFKLGL